MRRLPTPMKIAIVLALGSLVIVLAIATRVLLDELPEHMQETIAQRFGEEIEVLARVAEEFPLDPCGEMGTDALLAQVGKIREWRERMDSNSSLLADPVILGAEFIISCGDHESRFQVKHFDAFAPLWTPSLSAVSEERPSVSLWYSGTRRVVRYEDRVSGSTTRTTSVRLLLDLDGLALR